MERLAARTSACCVLACGGARLRRMALTMRSIARPWRPPSSIATSCRPFASRAVQASGDIVTVSCPRRPRRSRRRTSLRAPAAISTSATSISAITSRKASCWREIVAPELDHQIAQAEATLGQLKAALQQAQANMDLAQVTWDRDSPLVEQGLGDPAAGHHRRADPQGAAGRGRRRASQCRGAAGAAPGSQSAEGLSERRRAVRRRHHPAQYRCRQPGAGRRDQRHFHVHASCRAM